MRTTQCHSEERSAERKKLQKHIDEGREVGIRKERQPTQLLVKLCIYEKETIRIRPY